jgi:hypothetical protein
MGSVFVPARDCSCLKCKPTRHGIGQSLEGAAYAHCWLEIVLQHRIRAGKEANDMREQIKRVQVTKRELEEAKEREEIAWQNFNWAVDPDFTDAAIMELNTARFRRNLLIKLFNGQTVNGLAAA